MHTLQYGNTLEDNRTPEERIAAYLIRMHQRAHNIPFEFLLEFLRTNLDIQLVTIWNKYLDKDIHWKRGEVVLLLLCAASPKASLLGRRASRTLGDTTRPTGPRSTQPQPLRRRQLRSASSCSCGRRVKASQHMGLSCSV